VADSLVAEFEVAVALAVRAVGSLPLGQASWRPHPRSRSLAEQAQHFAALLGYTENLATASGHDLEPSFTASRAGSTAASSSARAPAEPASFSLPDLLQRLRSAATRAARLLAELDTVKLGEAWTLSHGGHPLVTLPRAVALQVFLINHLRHHLAQFELSLLLAGVALPEADFPAYPC
jgi:hypothetical protein